MILFYSGYNFVFFLRVIQVPRKSRRKTGKLTMRWKRIAVKNLPTLRMTVWLIYIKSNLNLVLSSQGALLGSKVLTRKLPVPDRTAHSSCMRTRWILNTGRPSFSGLSGKILPLWTFGKVRLRSGLP
jgi:hypothetical protein